MVRTTSIVLGSLVLMAATAAAAPVAVATHAYDCNITDNENVNDAYCTPHRAWDCLSSGGWKRIIACVLG